MLTLDPQVEEHHAKLERSWTVVDATNEYSRLVVPVGNSQEPVHRWFHLKEAFSHALLRRVLKDLDMEGLPRLRVLDCFAGGGTTLVSATDMADEFERGIVAAGIERNPFLFHVAATKVASASGSAGLTQDIKLLGKQVQEALGRKRPALAILPNQSTWKNEKFFSREARDGLLQIRAAIEMAEPGLAKDIALLAAAASVEPSSQLRRDGRALRYEPSKLPKDPKQEFHRRLTLMAEDISHGNRPNVKSHVTLGDGRDPSKSTNSRSKFDLILFSPPYPNNIDYTEVYKVEAWYLGLYSDEAQFKTQRLATVRSHPSVQYPEDYDYESSSHSADVEELISPLLAAVPVDRYFFGRRRMIKGYADDMLNALTSCRTMIADNGRLVFVVGNSLHGAATAGFVIAADVIMARLAELAGWRVREIRIARTPARRRAPSKFLRESIVVVEPA